MHLTTIRCLVQLMLKALMIGNYHIESHSDLKLFLNCWSIVDHLSLVGFMHPSCLITFLLYAIKDGKCVVHLIRYGGHSWRLSKARESRAPPGSIPKTPR
jgi:hypothetical protein